MDLKKLFIEELNYEPVFKKIRIPEIEKKENVLDLEIAFEKNDFQIILGRLKNLNPEFEKIIIKNLKKDYPDAIYLFSTPDYKQINVYNIKLTEDKKEKIRKLTYDEINNKTQLFKEKIRFFEVSEDITGKLSLKEKIDTAFDTEKVTKKFYIEFKKYHDKFLKFIKGIPVEKDAEWYTSVILNRLMFIYFIQKKGFINDDYDYLKNKFNEIEKQGKNFYSDFLVDLFFIGFATKNKTDDFKKKYGNIPYLNGGLFLPHTIENKYKDITIANEAFKEIIDYFDRYVWYLDERPLRNENEINPDILGYIFEKYINQKELGAYYTKEDITGYICRNTIIPYIFDRIGLKNYEQFLKKINIEDYVYKDITDREKRVKEVEEAHQKGEIKDINDFISYNLDIEKFALDFVDNLKDEETLKHLYFDILKNIRILDPTVGSGAFLFAALNILFPIYEKIINKKFLEFKKTNSKYWRTFFEPEIQKIKEHPNVNYYILKTIIVNNLYGVDIVEEATEICKLRLFLKLAAQIDDVNHIEPLPDIDFNIKAGNTLVGLVDITKDDVGLFIDSIKDEIAELDKKLSQFRRNQLTLGEQIAKNFEFYQEQKKDIQKILTDLNIKINQKQKDDYGVRKYDDFIDNYKPFNWYVEFNEIIKDGGFDVIIGNPPYVEYSKVRNQYQIKGYKTESCGNLYAFIVERSLNLLKNEGRFGMIVPLSFVCSNRMVSLRSLIVDKNYCMLVSNYADRPAKIFEGAEQLVSIVIIYRNIKTMSNIYTTKLIRWYREERDCLMKNLQYYELQIKKINVKFNIPKINYEIEENILNKLEHHRCIGENFSHSKTKFFIYYRISGGRYFKLFIDFIPIFKIEGKSTRSTADKFIYLNTEEEKYITLAVLNSNLYYWFYIIFSDIRNNPIEIIGSFPFNFISLNLKVKDKLINLSKELMVDIRKNSTFLKEIKNRIIKGKKVLKEETHQKFFLNKSKHIIDEIDRELAKHYGFTEEELNFIINYDIKFRMGKEEED